MSHPIDAVVRRWHDFMSGMAPDALDDLLAEDFVFYSPVVFTPQRGKDFGKMYLTAAGFAIGDGGTPGAPTGSFIGGRFHYTHEIRDGHMAMLEFTTVVDDIEVNGVDIMTCNDEGKIIEFKVMIRPLQAIHIVYKKMAAMLDLMKGV